MFEIEYFFKKCLKNNMTRDTKVSYNTAYYEETKKTDSRFTNVLIVSMRQLVQNNVYKIIWSKHTKKKIVHFNVIYVTEDSLEIMFKKHLHKHHNICDETKKYDEKVMNIM